MEDSGRVLKKRANGLAQRLVRADSVGRLGVVASVVAVAVAAVAGAPAGRRALFLCVSSPGTTHHSFRRLATTLHSFLGSFSSVSKRNFASKYAFCSIFQNLQNYLADFWKFYKILQTFAKNCKILTNFPDLCKKRCWFFAKIADFLQKKCKNLKI